MLFFVVFPDALNDISISLTGFLISIVD